MDWHTTINKAKDKDPELACIAFFHDKWRPDGKHRPMSSWNGTKEKPYLWMYLNEDVEYTVIEQVGNQFTPRPITSQEVKDLGNEGWHYTSNVVICGEFFPLI